MITETDILWWCALDKACGFSDVKRVCELGQQELAWKTPTAKNICERFAKICGTRDVDLTLFNNSLEFWGALGRELISIDIEGRGPSLRRMDLNTDSVPRHLKGKFDFVNNIGTSEHIINQMNLFHVMHDLTRTDGLMVHSVPCGGYTGHGLFNYNLKFFTLLAKANGYHCVDAWMSVAAETKGMRADVTEFLQGGHGMFSNARSSPSHPTVYFGDQISRFKGNDAGIYVALRKSSPIGKFKLPLDADG